MHIPESDLKGNKLPLNAAKTNSTLIRRKSRPKILNNTEDKINLPLGGGELEPVDVIKFIDAHQLSFFFF